MLGDLVLAEEGWAGVGEGTGRQGRQGLGVLNTSGPQPYGHRVGAPHRHHPAQGRQAGAVGGVQGGGVQGRDHVRTAPRGAGQGLVPPGTGNTAVVPRQQDRVHGQVPPGGGPGVDLVLQQPGSAVGLLDHGVRVAQDPGQEPGHGLDHHQGGRLPAVEDVVADRELTHLHAPGAVVLGDAGVNALIASAGQDQVLGTGQVLDDPLGQDVPGGGGDDEHGAAPLRGVRPGTGCLGGCPRRPGTVWSGWGGQLGTARRSDRGGPGATRSWLDPAAS